MSSKQELKTGEKAAITKSFVVRNIKKDFTEPLEVQTITSQFHLELGENGEAVKVEDRKRDWVELANKDVDKVGLAYVLELARRRGDSLEQFAFKDSESLDTSMIDPLDPESVKKSASSVQSNMTKLQAMADKLGVTVDELISATIDGSLSKIISEKVEQAAKSKESEASE